MAMKSNIKSTLIRLAKESEGTGTNGQYKLAAGVVFKGRLVATGVNSYKSHPLMMNNSYHEAQIGLHAEVDALVRASKRLTPCQMAQSMLCVVRVKRDTTGDWTYGNACPCAGCMSVISEFGIKGVEYTYD